MRVPFSSPSRWSRVALIGLAISIGLGSLPAVAADNAAAKQSLQEQIDQLKREVERLERANAAVEPMVDEKFNKQYVTAGFNAKDGFFIQDPSKTYRLKFRGYTQLDGRFFIDDPGSRTTDQFVFRRVRPILEGSLTKFIDFKIMPDFAGADFRLFDAYVDVKPFDYYKDWAKLRVGKFKTGVGLERLQSATAIDLVERSAASNLVPTRDTGVELWGAPWSGTLLYQLGVFDGAADGGNVNNNLGDDFTFAGRVFAQPFVTWPTDSALSPLRGLGVGVGGSWGEMGGSASSPDLPTYRSFGQATIFQYVNGGAADNTAFSSGTLSRINPQLYYYWGPFGSMFEYVQSTTPVQLDDTRGEVRNDAWMIQASWVLTGEDAGFRGVTPAQNFNPWAGRWGAFEVVARYDELDIDRNAFDLGFADPNRSIRSSQGFGGGINWYWSTNIKVVLDYYHTWFKGGASGGTGNRATEDVIITRLQLNL